MSAAQFLEKFLFPRDMHYNFVHKLSGGEKRRLKLMTVLMKNPNFLILDEPTNDLDIFVMGVLEEYLRNFEGCLIVVSHDRYFMDKMVDHLFVFEGDGEISDILGNYTVFRNQKRLNQREIKKNEQITSKIPSRVSSDSKDGSKRKLSYKENQEFLQLETELERLELEKKELTKILSDSSSTSEELVKAGYRLGEVVADLDKKSDRWLELSEYM
jgi:ATP-binding cassette subfamily F protein uup